MCLSGLPLSLLGVLLHCFERRPHCDKSAVLCLSGLPLSLLRVLLHCLMKYNEIGNNEIYIADEAMSSFVHVKCWNAGNFKHILILDLLREIY